MKLWPWRAAGWQQLYVVGYSKAVDCSSGSRMSECTAEMGLALTSSSRVPNHSAVL